MLRISRQYQNRLAKRVNIGTNTAVIVFLRAVSVVMACIIPPILKNSRVTAGTIPAGNAAGQTVTSSDSPDA